MQPLEICFPFLIPLPFNTDVTTITIHHTSPEIFLNDILIGACLPFILYFVAHGSYHIQAWYSSDLIFLLLQVLKVIAIIQILLMNILTTQMTILLTHLIFLCTNSSCSSTSCCSIFQVDLYQILEYLIPTAPAALSNC